MCSAGVSLFEHVSRIDDYKDAKTILFVILLEGRNTLPERPHITWLKTAQNDLRSHNLTLTETLDVAQNCSLWKLLATFGTVHSGGASWW